MSPTTKYLAAFILWLASDIYLYNKNSNDYYIYTSLLNVLIQSYFVLFTYSYTILGALSLISSYYSFYLIWELLKLQSLRAVAINIGTSISFLHLLYVVNRAQLIMPKINLLIDSYQMFNAFSTPKAENIREPNISDIFNLLPQMPKFKEPTKPKKIYTTNQTVPDEQDIKNIMLGITSDISEAINKEINEENINHLEKLGNNISRIVDIMDEDALSDLEEEENEVIKSVTNQG